VPNSDQSVDSSSNLPVRLGFGFGAIIGSGFWLYWEGFTDRNRAFEEILAQLLWGFVICWLGGGILGAQFWWLANSRPVRRSLRWSGVPRPAWLWPARLACTGAFAALMGYEWTHWPNGSPLLGPLGIVWYNGMDVATLVLCAGSLAMAFAFLLKPHPAMAVLSLLGGGNWWLWGVLAVSMGC
jgi:hypothetical protein